MAYFRTLPKLSAMLDLFSRDDAWLILINADPDAMASATALKRIMRQRVGSVAIAKVNEITRPDNLAMIQFTRIHMEKFTPEMLSQYSRFALVDSQPSHHPAFQSINFSIIIDHHPLDSASLAAPYTDIRPEYGATSTLLTEYLYNLHIRPGRLLATAMQFGIKTDTSSFERHFIDVDLRAYQYLSHFSSHILLSRIARSDFHRHWLEFFARACTNMYTLPSGQYAFIGAVDNPDLLVIIADFFMRVYGIQWVAVAGLYKGSAIIVFRTDGVSRNAGKYATELFGDLGSAGGHKDMARAEFLLEQIEGKDPELFIWQRLTTEHKREVRNPPLQSTAQSAKENASLELDLPD